MLEKARGYLATAPPFVYGDGGYFLMAMALMKAGEDEGHPLVRLAVEKAQKLAAQVAQKGVGGTCYNEGICCYFLCDLDAVRYRQEISVLLEGMLRRQRPNGCWGYSPHSYDDTSQTQYGVLCLWAAHQTGFPVPGEAVERAANWLMRVQDASGGWVYSPRDPQTFERNKQGAVTLSMSAAGLSSVYICAHLLGFTARTSRVEQESEPNDGLPPAVQRVESEQEKRRKATVIRPTSTSGERIRSTQELGNAWFEANLKIDIPEWTHYYMYALERYQSFRELTEGKAVAEPAWYNEGVEYLRKTQAADGSWRTEKSHNSGQPVDTAFAVLFLTRSSQTAIRKAVLEEGILIGGKGLPKNLANLKMVDGQVVTPQMVRDVDDLLELLAQADDKEFDATQLPGGLTLDEDLTRRTSQLARLRELVSDPDFQKRLAAVKTLGKSHDLDNVPALIYALSDPDLRVVREARDGLRLISRRFHGFGLPPDPTPEQRGAAQRKWQDWYLSIRPDGQLIE